MSGSTHIRRSLFSLIVSATLAATQSTHTPVPNFAVIQERQSLSSIPSDCHLEYTTDVWTGCAQILEEFNISLAEFQHANPNITANCANFVPGQNYCIHRASGSPTNVSTNGLCGYQQNWTSTCVGSGYGDCCGSGGFCGTGEDYCGIGNCQEGSCDGGQPYSTDGNCGVDFEYLPCPPKFGSCCSQYGSCGNSSEFCGTGCQSGPCSAPSSSSSSQALPTSTQAPFTISQDGTCGFTNKLLCKGSKFGSCCSAAGYCGGDLYHCSDLLGCQPSFGTCNQTTSSTTGPGLTTTAVPTQLSSSSTMTATAVPSPTQPDSIISTCTQYAIAQTDDTCEVFAQEHGITTDELYEWNSVLGVGGSNCGSKLLLGYYYCIAV